MRSHTSSKTLLIRQMGGTRLWCAFKRGTAAQSSHHLQRPPTSHVCLFHDHFLLCPSSLFLALILALSSSFFTTTATSARCVLRSLVPKRRPRHIPTLRLSLALHAPGLKNALPSSLQIQTQIQLYHHINTIPTLALPTLNLLLLLSGPPSANAQTTTLTILAETYMQVHNSKHKNTPNILDGSTAPSYVEIHQTAKDTRDVERSLQLF